MMFTFRIRFVRNFILIIIFMLSGSFVYAEKPEQSYEVVLSVSNVNISENIIDADVEIYFDNISLYNEDIRLSFHLYDLNNKILQFENTRRPFSLSEGKAIVNMKIDMTEMNIPVDIKDIIVRFDLVDQRNIYWFSGKPELFLSTEVVFPIKEIANPKGLLKNTVSSSKEKVTNRFLLKNIIENQKILLFINVLVWFFIILGFIFYKKSQKKRQSLGIASFYSTTIPATPINSEPAETLCIHNNSGFWKWLADKLFVNIYKEFDKLDKHQIDIENELRDIRLNLSNIKGNTDLLGSILKKQDETATLSSQFYEEHTNLITALHGKTDANASLVTALHVKTDANTLLISKLLCNLDINANTSLITALHGKTDAYASLVTALHVKTDANTLLISKLLCNLDINANTSALNLKNLFYETFLKLNNLDAIPSENNAKQDLYDSCEKASHIDDELVFLNETPLNILADHVANYKDIVAYGWQAEALIRYMGKGKSYKHFFSPTVQKTINEELIVPPALLAEYIGKIECLIITNPALAMVLIRSYNILESIKDNISGSIFVPINVQIAPVEVSWHGFSQVELNNSSNCYRWAIGFDQVSKIKIRKNRSFSNIKISFNVASLYGKGILLVSALGDEVQYNLDGSKTVNLTGSFDESTEIILNFISENNFAINDKRELKFNISNLTITCDNHTVCPRETIAQSQAVMLDGFIEKRLHDIKFMNLEKNIVYNKEFLQVKNMDTVIDFARDRNLSELFIYYKANKGE